MGSFWGHIDEGIFFTLLAIWWIFNACHQYIESQQRGTPMKPRISYSMGCRKEIPVETIFKILFPLAGFLAELLDGGVAFMDEEGKFRKMVYAQHMTIYGIFVLHAFIDLLTWMGFPMIPGAAHVSAALSFLWYGVAFYYHAQMHGKQPLESVVHVLPICVMLPTAGAVLLELGWRTGVWTLLARSLGLLTLGTWFSNVAFMLYEHDKFPGGGTSGWDRSDLRNVQYARASFGLHLLFNMLFIVLCYVITYLVMRLRHKVRLNVTYDDDWDDAREWRRRKYEKQDPANTMLLEDCA
ncbi:hypothetical protein ACOMHN_038548 [Nucella lapillus]